MQAAYESGVEEAAPPPMPGKTVYMMPYIIGGSFVIGLVAFFVILLFGSVGDEMSVALQWGLTALALAGIVAVLVVSYFAFQRIVKSDAEASEHYPAWDRAMSSWGSLAYCANDNIIFDPKTGQKVSDRQLEALRSTGNAGFNDSQAAQVARQH
jgi:hypothetical protein